MTEGAVANLAKYVSKHKKKLFVFDDNQIFEIIKQHSRFETAHILKDLSNWTGKLNIDTNVLFDCVSLDNFHVYLNQYKDNKSLIYSIYAYKIFNEIVDCDISKDENIDKNNVVVESRYYSINNSALHEEITDNIKAFDLFSSEIVLRNRNMADNKKVKIAFQENIRQFNLLSKHEYTVVLYPGQCIAAVFYFRAMNDSIQLKLPLPLIEVNERILNLPFDNTILNCSVVGETPYLGNDSISLNECCTELNKIARKFETVVVYGKSGVGKSRFLYELQKVRMQNQNTCFVFHGDNLCHSTYDFLRRIILGYYNISFNSQTGKIELPFYEENFIHDKLFIKNISFIESIISNIYGVSNSSGLPNVFQKCEYDNFQTISTISRIKRANLTRAQTILITIIKKIFSTVSKGNGRKEEALLRGLGEKGDSRICDKILNMMIKEDILNKHRGDDGWIYSPNLKHTSRMLKILSDLTNSHDVLWEYANSL